MRKNIVNIIIGVLISAGCVYFAFKNIALSEIIDSLRSVKYIYILPVVLLVVFAHFLRSYRWGIILDTLVKYDQKTLFALSSIGFMAVGLLPARLGEFARPYLVKQKSGVKMSSTMATIIVERVFDLMTLMLFMFAVILKIDLPSEVVKAGITMLSISAILFFVLIFLAVKKDSSLNKIDLLLNRLPDRLGKPLYRLAHSFIDGLQILPDVKKTLYVAFLSISIWTVISLSAYTLFFAYDFNLSFINGIAVTVIIALGVMLPAAPGFLGTYHVACKIGLVCFGVAQKHALSYAILLHFFQMMPIIALGLIYLPFQKLSLPAFIKREEAELEDEGLAD